MSCCVYHIRKGNAKLAKLLFTALAPTGFVSTRDNHQKLSNTSEKVADVQARNKNDTCTDVYINNREASHIDVTILAMVMLTMCLIVISTFW